MSNSELDHLSVVGGPCGAYAQDMQTASEKQVSPGESLKVRLEAVQQRIKDAADRSGRRSKDIILVAVTKHASIDEIRELIKLGHVDFGENRVQNLVQRAAQVDEFLQRHKELTRGRRSDVPKQVRWHMIGHLQRNKVRRVMPLVRLIHSVDSLRLVEEIQTGATKREEPIEILIQVNTAGEKSKFGVAPAAVRHLIDQIDTMMNIRVRGLMCMAPIVEDPAETRRYFELAKELFDDTKRSSAGGDCFDILSMGMSNDFEVAIECGANIVRVGTAIFGEHTEEPTPDEQ